MDTRDTPADRGSSGFWGVEPYQRPSPEQVAETQRRRLLLGITRAVARKGYGEASVADVLAEVRVSRRTFYELFKDKEDCYLAAYEVAHNAMIAAIRDRQRGVADPLDRFDRAHRAFLDFIRAEPEVASSLLVGVLEAGPRAADRRQRAWQDFADLHVVLHRQCRARYRSLPEVPRLAFMALTAGTNMIVTDEIRQRGTKKLMDLLPTVLYLSYSVYGLHEQAAALDAGRGGAPAATAPPRPRRSATPTS